MQSERALQKSSCNLPSSTGVREKALVPRAIKPMFSQASPPLSSHFPKWDSSFMNSSNSPKGSLLVFLRSKSRQIARTLLGKILGYKGPKMPHSYLWTDLHEPSWQDWSGLVSVILLEKARVENSTDLRAIPNDVTAGTGLQPFFRSKSRNLRLVKDTISRAEVACIFEPGHVQRDHEWPRYEYDRPPCWNIFASIKTPTTVSSVLLGCVILRTTWSPGLGLHGDCWD
jgi:hypothetical protein